MTSRRWYAVAVAAAIDAAALVLIAADASGALLDTRFGGVYAGLVVGSWLLLPVGVYLDLRTLDDVPWNPSTARWVAAAAVPVASTGAGVAYCIRRFSAVRRTVPSGYWYYGVIAGSALWAVAFAVEVAVDYVPAPPVVYGGFTSLVTLLLVGFPAVLYLDLAHVRGYTDDRIPVGRMVALSLVPYVSALVGAAYLYRRHTAFRDTDDPDGLDLVDGSKPSGSTVTSPWYPRAGAVFGAHLLLVVVLAAFAPSVGSTAIQLAAILLWLPFGPFFAACVYKDAAWRREHGVGVGDNWWLYLISALVQAAAFWYVVRRASRFSGRRYGARHADSGGGDGSESGTGDPMRD